MGTDARPPYAVAAMHEMLVAVMVDRMPSIASERFVASWDRARLPRV